MTSYTLRYEKRPWTLNLERQGAGGGKYKRAALTKEWRGEFARQAAGLAPLARCEVTVQPETRNNVMADTGACVGAAKAAIDGLVDAGVLEGDGPRIVRRLTFLAPVNTGVDALVIIVEGEAA